MTDPAKQALSELKVIASSAVPSDELWVHPRMFDLLQQAFLEADIMRGCCGAAARQTIEDWKRDNG